LLFTTCLAWVVNARQPNPQNKKRTKNDDDDNNKLTNPKRGTYRAAAEISLTWTKTFLGGVLGKNPNYSTLCSNIPAEEESHRRHDGPTKTTKE